MKKKWKKRVASVVLAVAMIVTQIGIWNAGGTQVNAATGSWVATDLVKNGDFETALSTEWTIEMPTADADTNGYKVKAEGTNNTTNFFNFWSNGSARSFSMTQEISDVAAGTYRLTFDQEGAADATSGLTISVNGISLTQSATTGWDNWAKVTTDEFTLSETGTITITISGNINAGYWGDFDNFVIQKYSEEQQATTVTSFIDDFNDDKTEGWTTNWSGSAGTFTATSTKSPFGNAGLNIYSASAQTLTASYTVSNLEAGTYAVSMKNVGKDLAATVTVSGDGVTEITKNLTFGAWGSTVTNKTSSFAVSKTTNLTIKMAVDFQAGGWGWIDDVELAPSTGGTTADDKYEVSINSTVDSVEVGESVTLTATVTKNGAAVTNLEGSGVHLYWWTTDDSQMGWLANRDENGYLFTVKVKPTEVGSCEINAEIKDDGDSQIAIEKKTVQATACTTAVVGKLNITKIADLSDDFIMGMDISSMISEIQSGVVYKDYSGTALYENSDTLQDKLNKTCKFLADNGVTDIRIRVWNDPYNSEKNGYGGGNNDVAKAKMFADAARYAGLKMMVDFHCSDFWCDPSKQKAPKAWDAMNLDDKGTALKTFITESLTAIDAGKDVVTKVQVGNETTNGFVGETDKANMCTLYKAGIQGVEAYNEKVETVIHLTNPEKNQMTSWAKVLNENNVNYDILATSYYPYWHGTFENLKSEFNKVQTTYGKKCMVAETSYAYTLDDTDGHENTVRKGNNDTSTKWPFTVQGQATYMRDVMNAVNEAGGLGVFYWESAWITVGDTTGLSESELENKTNDNKLLWEQYGSGWASSYSSEYDPTDAGKCFGGSAVDNQAFFAADGTALNSLYVYQYVYTGAETNEIEIQEIENPSAVCYLGDAISLPSQVTVKFNKGNVVKTVKWAGTPSSKKVGTYTINGTITLNSDEVPNQGTYAGCTTIPTTFTYEVKHTNLLDADVAGFSVADAYVTSDSALNTYDLKPNDVVEAGNPVMHWYDGSNAIDGFAITKDEIKLSAGTYCLSAETQGEKGAVQLQIVDEEEQIVGQSESVACEGWHVFKYPSVSFTLSEEKNIRVKILVTGEAGSWGTVDNLYLYDVNATEYVVPTPVPPTPDSGADNNNTGDYSGATETAPGSSAKPDDTTVTKNEDGTTTETKTESTTNESGKEVETTVTTQKDADGKVTGSTEVSTIANVAKNTEVTVTVEKDADGKVAEAAAEVTRKGAETKTGTKGTIAGVVVDQIKEAAGTADIAITTSVTDAKGKEKYSVTVNASDLVAGEKLTVVVKDEKTGKTVLVDAKQVKVTVNGGVNVVLPEGKDYTLIDTKEAEKVTKEILKTVAPVKTSATLKEGKKATAKLSKKLDMDNVKKITYVSSKKSVATVDQNGKVTAKKAGTVIISIKVTLNNGTTKTVKMKYKVK